MGIKSVSLDINTDVSTGLITSNCVVPEEIKTGISGMISAIMTE